MNMSTDQTTPVFYTCPICGNTVEMIVNSGRPLFCCGKEMTRLIPSSTDGAVEKHIPVFNIADEEVIVKVGSSPHPMLPAHHISWVELITDKGIQRKHISHKEDPLVCFHIGKNEKVIAVCAFCNLHGLWIAR